MGDEYEVLVARDVRTFLEELDDKSRQVVEESLRKLSNPYPGRGVGDKEKITWRGDEVYRLHIGRTWTAFYDVHETDEEVRVLDIMSIDQAHKEYGDLD
jgi:mRNA-degrading endonuclease RelE of RelBE toxin-antitoxin system